MQSDRKQTANASVDAINAFSSSFRRDILKTVRAGQAEVIVTGWRIAGRWLRRAAVASYSATCAVASPSSTLETLR